MIDTRNGGTMVAPASVHVRFSGRSGNPPAAINQPVVAENNAFELKSL